MTRRRTFAALLSLVLLPITAGGGAPPAHAADAFERPHIPYRLSVRFHPGASQNRSHDRAGTTVVRRLVDIRTEVVAVPNDEDPRRVAERYADDPDVASVEPVYTVRPYVVPNDPRFAEQWALDNPSDTDIDAPQGWDVRTSTPVHVAVIDTGFNRNHPDLQPNFKARIVQGACPGFVSNCDHATLIAGIAGAVGNNGTGVAGTAWDVPLLDVEFDFTDVGVSEAFMDVADYAQSNGVKVVATAAFGAQGSCPDNVSQALNYARDRGVLIVAAAGNEGRNNDLTGDWPSGCPQDNLIAVASTTRNGGLADFSNFGASTVDIAAPGVDILTTAGSGGFDDPSGTSISAPMVASTAALVWGGDTSMTYAQVRSRVLDTVDKVSGLSGRIASGGRLNLARALGGTPDSSAPATPAPTVGPTSSPNQPEIASGSISGTTFAQSGGGLFGALFGFGGGGPQPTGGVTVRTENRSVVSESSGDYTLTELPSGQATVTASRATQSLFGGGTVACSADSQNGPTSKTVEVPVDGNVTIDWFCGSGGGFASLFGGFGSFFGGGLFGGGSLFSLFG